MSDPFIGQISMFAGTFAPRDWAYCDGALLPVAQNPALFSIIGTRYGGNGETNFALPNLVERFPVHAGMGPGLTRRNLGATGGNASVTLTPAQLPGHSHRVRASSADTSEEGENTPAGHVLGHTERTATLYGPATDLADLDSDVIAPFGASPGGVQAHENRQPFLAVRFIIALAGVFPTRA